jgi:hypothetical protein
VQEIVKAVGGQERTLARWQKEQLVKLSLLGESARAAVAVGRAANGVPLQVGVEARLLHAMRVLCAPEAKALKPSHAAHSKVEAAAQLLLQLYLEVALSGFGLSPEDMQVRLCIQCTHNSSGHCIKLETAYILFVRR